MSFTDRPRDEIQQVYEEQSRAHDRLREAGHRLDLTRGKPSPAQLDLSNPLLALPGADYLDTTGTDVRNYGGGRGLVELREIFAALLDAPVDQVVSGENASLAMMHDLIVFALLKGTTDSPRPWAAEETVRFVCPVPGYDRHFAICEQYGIEMVTVPMTPDGPDLVATRELVADPSVKGMWLVPTYANPTGSVTTEAVARELAAMPTGAEDFRILWDNAYVVHHLTETRTRTPDILGLATEAGHPTRPWVIASTSKITFAGSGVAFFAGSPAEVEWLLALRGRRTIGPDKINQLRHARHLGDVDGVHALMDAHRELIAPKFAAVNEILRRRLGGLGVATWTEPAGGYFVSLDVLDGTAARVVELCAEAGIALTPAGSAFPYGVDPDDRNIRIAPTFPSVAEVETAIDALATCVLLAACERELVVR